MASLRCHDDHNKSLLPTDDGTRALYSVGLTDCGSVRSYAHSTRPVVTESRNPRAQKPASAISQSWPPHSRVGLFSVLIGAIAVWGWPLWSGLWSRRLPIVPAKQQSTLQLEILIVAKAQFQLSPNSDRRSELSTKQSDRVVFQNYWLHLLALFWQKLNTRNYDLFQAANRTDLLEDLESI